MTEPVVMVVDDLSFEGEVFDDSVARAFGARSLPDFICAEGSGDELQFYYWQYGPARITAEPGRIVIERVEEEGEP